MTAVPDLLYPEPQRRLDARALREALTFAFATGGTAEAAAKLIRKSGGNLIGAAFVIDLPDLGGVKRLTALGLKSHTLIAFEGH